MKGLAKSMVKSYQSGITRYKSFCMRLRRPSLPVSEDTLSAFVASLAKEGVSHTSLKVYLAAIQHYQIQGDPGISQMVRLEYVMKGIRRDGAPKPKPRKERQPITPALLNKLFAVWASRSDLRNSKMLWAASCLAFFAFLRVWEFTAPGISQFDDKVHLSVADVSVDRLDAPSMAFVCLKQSKTDQLRKGVTIVLGRTNKSPLCPVSALLSYLTARGLTPCPLFTWDSGKFLTRAHFVEVKKALQLVGADASDFNGHSFRIGAASTAAANGMEDSLIKTLGRWESNAYQRYIKIPWQELANYTLKLTS